MICLDNTDTLEGGASVAGVVDYTVHGLVGTAFTNIAQGQLSDTDPSVLYTAAAAISIVSVIFVNTHSAAVTVNLYLDPANAGTPRRMIPKNLSLGVGYSMVWDGARFGVYDTNGILMSQEIPRTVANGGTGATTLTDHGILLGSGTDAITPLGVASNGQIPIGSAGADPVLATLTGTANQITVTNGAGSITLSLPDTPTVASVILTDLSDGFIPYRNATTDKLANSPIQVSGSNVGIGVTPGVTCDVNGIIRSRLGNFQLNDGTTTGGAFLFYKTVIGSGTDLSPVIFAETGYKIYFAANGDIITWDMIIDVDGQVGIGKNPDYQLELSTDSAGKPSTSTWSVVSDERLKENIGLADLQRCYDIVKTLPLKWFTWKDEVYTVEQVKDRSKLGWISQDVATVFPKAVDVKKFEKVPIEDGIEEYEEQDFKMETVEEKVIEIQNSIPVQVKRLVERKKLLFKDVPVMDEIGKPVIDKDGKILTYQMPIMVKKTRPKMRVDVVEDCLSMNADQVYAAMYGAVQMLIQKVEKLESKLK